MTARSTRRIGDEGEEIACEFLKRQGYEIVERNFVHRHGEIDIVAREGGTLVFVEVKTRRTTAFGEPEEAVTPRKQELLRRTAEGYVETRELNDVDCRFDVVSVVLGAAKPECRLLKNCFY